MFGQSRYLSDHCVFSDQLPRQTYVHSLSANPNTPTVTNGPQRLGRNATIPEFAKVTSAPTTSLTMALRRAPVYLRPIKAGRERAPPPSYQNDFGRRLYRNISAGSVRSYAIWGSARIRKPTGNAEVLLRPR